MKFSARGDGFSTRTSNELRVIKSLEVKLTYKLWLPLSPSLVVRETWTLVYSDGEASFINKKTFALSHVLHKPIMSRVCCRIRSFISKDLVDYVLKFILLIPLLLLVELSFLWYSITLLVDVLIWVRHRELIEHLCGLRTLCCRG